MRWHSAIDQTARVGWSLRTEIREVNGKYVDYVYFKRGHEVSWLCPFTVLVMMSKADFATALAQLPQEKSA